MAVQVFKDHIQTVVGVESFLVAIKVPALLNAIMKIPCVGAFNLLKDDDVGGLAGCGAAT